MQPKKIVVAARKGGTDKSTIAAHIAAGMALRGLDVLLVDNDTQLNAGIILGYEIDLSEPPNYYEISPNLTLLTAGAGDMYLGTIPSNGYDVIVVDTPPDGERQRNALTYATHLAIPATADPLALRGVALLLNILPKQYEDVVIVPSRYKESEAAKFHLRNLRDTYQGMVASPVPFFGGMTRALTLGQTVFDFKDRRYANGTAKTVAAYNLLIDRLLGA